LFDTSSVVEVIEGEEPADFWTSLGSKPASYLDAGFYEKYNKKIRLICCSTKTGDFVTTEVPQFNQVDLSPDAIYLLDTWHDVYLWIGPESGQSERVMAEKTVKEYTQKASERRNKEVKLISLANEVVEPVQFTRHFHAWNMRESKMDPRQRTYLRHLEQLKQQEAARAEAERKKKEEEEKAKAAAEEAQNPKKKVKQKKSVRFRASQEEEAISPNTSLDSINEVVTTEQKNTTPNIVESPVTESVATIEIPQVQEVAKISPEFEKKRGTCSI